MGGKIVLAIAVGALTVGCSGAKGQPATEPNVLRPATPPARAETPTKPVEAKGDIKTADDLLNRLESADKDLKSLDAKIQYDRVFGLAGDRQLRKGMLHYVDSKEVGADGKPSPGSRKFAVQFTSLQLGAAAERTEEKIMVFDGLWLIEKSADLKEVHKRQIMHPGATFDPLKIGEGPFPIPIGQKREDILNRFSAELLPAEDGVVGNEPSDTPKLKDFVTKAKAYQLKLIPKPGKDSDFKEVRLWYAPQPGTGTLLPVMARTVNQQDDVSIVELVKVQLNQPLPAGVFDAAVPDGWKVDVQELPPEIRR